MGNEKRRHHYVPKSYLKAFTDTEGKFFVHRKDTPDVVHRQIPDNVAFRNYYYSQPTPDSDRDNNQLENFFSSLESIWPNLVERITNHENINDQNQDLFNFLALQRVRVPACRDGIEFFLSKSVKSLATTMNASGELPSLPAGLSMDDINFSIDPHQSIHAMVKIISGIGPFLDTLGYTFLHNRTNIPFLTSDNPVVWFAGDIGCDPVAPYDVSHSHSATLIFPISTNIVLIGETKQRNHFRRHGFGHSETTAKKFVWFVNKQICRFGYEAVFSCEPGFSKLTKKYSSRSPTLEYLEFETESGKMVLGGHVFARRQKKIKWR